MAYVCVVMFTRYVVSIVVMQLSTEWLQHINKLDTYTTHSKI